MKKRILDRINRTTIFTGVVIVAMLAMMPVVSATPFTWMGNVTYCSNSTLVPAGWHTYMENLNHPEFPGQPWNFATTSTPFWNAYAGGETQDDNDWIHVNVTNHNGCVGEFTARLGDILDVGTGNYIMDFCVTCATPDVDWPQFHYDIENAGNSPADAPDVNDVGWVSPTIGAVEGSQTMIAQDRVFAYAGSSLTALWKTNGTVNWTTPVTPSTTWGAWQSPGWHDEMVFVGSGDKVYCMFGVNGTVSWTTTLPTVVTVADVCDSSPTIANDLVFIGDWVNGIYYALNETTGSISHQYNVGGSPQSTVAVDDGELMVFFGNGSGNTVFGAAKHSDTILWNRTLSGYVGGSVAVDTVNHVLYVTAGSDLWALNEVDGTNYAGWATNPQPILATSSSTPAIAYGNVYVCSDWSLPGNTFCFNATTGAPVWHITGYGSWTNSPAAAVDNKILVGRVGAGWPSATGTAALDPATGALIWVSPLGGSSPSIANSNPMAVTVGADGKVYAATPLSPVTVEMDDHTMSPSGTLVAPIWINLIEDYGAATITVNYNNSVVIVAAVNDGPFSDVVASSIDNTAGEVRISAQNTYGVDGNIEFARIEFDAVGTYDDFTLLDLSVQKLVDVNYTVIDHTIDNGLITLKETDPPVISNEMASPAKIIQTNITGRARPANRAISRLSADVVDLGSGVDTVTVDLTPIGWGATTSMSGTGTYTVDTNATSGLNQLHNLVVTATDNNNNIATSTIALEVLIRGDVVRGTGTTVKTNVNIGDALYIARHTVGLEPVADNWLLVGDVVGEAGNPLGDDLVDMADALYIVRYALNKEDEP